MERKNSAVLDFLLSRRSRPAKMLGLPVPDRQGVLTLLTAAARAPDHGALVPWRFIVLERGALLRLSELALSRAQELGLDRELAAKGHDAFARSHLAVAVVASPKPSGNIPAVEQTLSAGAVCLSLLNAGLACGWGANWITGWPAHDRGFVEKGLTLAPGEQVAGFVHLGTATARPPERPRPDVESITTWLD